MTKNNEGDPVTKYCNLLDSPIGSAKADAVDSPVSHNLLIKSDPGSPKSDEYLMYKIQQ